MGSFSAYVKSQVQSGQLNLTQYGLPAASDRLEFVDYNYFDTVFIPLTTVGTMTQQTQLFNKEIGSGLARNFKFPTTSDSVFSLEKLLITASFTLDPTLAVGGTTVFGPMVNEAARLVLESTSITQTYASKRYQQTTIDDYANYNLPMILDGVTDQSANAPLPVFQPTPQSHHQTVYMYGEDSIWPANTSVEINVVTNVPSFWKDFTNGAALLPASLFNIALQVNLKFNFIGAVARVLK